MADYRTYTVTNSRKAGRGIYGKTGMIRVPAGATVEVEMAEAVAADESRIAGLSVKAADDSKADAHLPGLTGKSKAQLLEIAADEGVEIEEGATNEDIRSAIELHREG